jgi:hypothetical protein
MAAAPAFTGCGGADVRDDDPPAIAGDRDPATSAARRRPGAPPFGDPKPKQKP